MKNFILMNKDNPILNLEYDFDSHSISKINKKFNVEYCSPAMLNPRNEITRKGINSWWRNRAIPYSRNGLNNLLDRVSLDHPLGFVENNLGLSLSDCYWLNDPDNLRSWKDINFFNNDFSEELGLIILDGEEIINPNLMNPSGSVDGNLPKKWSIKDGQRILVKGSSGLFAQEPFNELIMSRLYERLLDKDDFLTYNLEFKDNHFYSECPCMLDGTNEYIPMYDLLCTEKHPKHLNDFQWMMNALGKTGISDVSTTLSKLFACDFIMGNDDRHWRNFGLLRDVDTQEYTRIAPFFDGGSSLWLNAINLKAPIDWEYQAKPFGFQGMKPNKQLELFNDFSWFNPDSLAGFDNDIKSILSQNPIFPKDRLDAICSHVEHNIQALSQHAERCDINLKDRALSISLDSEAKDMSAAKDAQDTPAAGHDKDKGVI